MPETPESHPDDTEQGAEELLNAINEAQKECRDKLRIIDKGKIPIASEDKLSVDEFRKHNEYAYSDKSPVEDLKKVADWYQSWAYYLRTIIESPPPETSPVAEGVAPAETSESAEQESELSRRERKIAEATQDRRKRTENFVNDHVATFLEMTARREAGRLGVKNRISELWAKKRLEGEISKIQETIRATKERLDKYQARFDNLQASLDRLEQLSENRPKIKSKLDALRERIAPQMVELSDLISIQEVLLKENGDSLRLLAGGMDKRLPAIEAVGIKAGVPGIPGTLEAGEAWATFDDYMNEYDNRLGQLFGTTGPELPANYRSKRSAIENFFRFILGIGETETKSAGGTE